MINLFHKIKELKDESLHSKHEQLVNGVINALNQGILNKGDRLPSINKMVNELGYARKTIVRAYEDLKSRGLIESKNFKGYYVLNTDTKVKLKVALLLYAFHSFQEDFYNKFRKELGEKYHIDVFFHHNNIDIFKNIVNSISGKYGMYVIAPIPSVEVQDILKQFSSDKLLIIDRFIELPKEYSYISQEFETATFSLLEELLPAIKKYNEVILFYTNKADLPVGIKNAFERFTNIYKIKSEIKEEYEHGLIKPNTLYFTIKDSDLWLILRDCKSESFEIGKDIGILAHNDNTIKEIIAGGITTISTDFKEMGSEAAKLIKSQSKVHKIIPLEIKRRNSL